MPSVKLKSRDGETVAEFNPDSGLWSGDDDVFVDYLNVAYNPATNREPADHHRGPGFAVAERAAKAFDLVPEFPKLEPPPAATIV